MKVRIAATARADLKSIAMYIAQDSRDRAMAFTKALPEKCERLADRPMASPVAGFRENQQSASAHIAIILFSTQYMGNVLMCCT